MGFSSGRRDSDNDEGGDQRVEKFSFHDDPFRKRSRWRAVVSIWFWSSHAYRRRGAADIVEVSDEARQCAVRSASDLTKVRRRESLLGVSCGARMRENSIGALRGAEGLPELHEGAKVHCSIWFDLQPQQFAKLPRIRNRDCDSGDR